MALFPRAREPLQIVCTCHFTPDELPVTPASRLWASLTPAHMHTHKHTHMPKLIRIDTLTHTHIFLPFPTPLSFMLTHTSNTHIPLTLTQTLHTHTYLHSHNHSCSYTHIITHAHRHGSHTSLLCFKLVSYPYSMAHTHPCLKLILTHLKHTSHFYTVACTSHAGAHLFSHVFTLLHTPCTHTYSPHTYAMVHTLGAGGRAQNPFRVDGELPAQEHPLLRQPPCAPSRPPCKVCCKTARGTFTPLFP